jgi:hypothetical protein
MKYRRTFIVVDGSIRHDICSEKWTWNVRTKYRAGSLTSAARELARYKLNLVVVKEFGYDKGGIVRAGDHNFFYAKANENYHLGTGFLYTTE